MVYGLLSYRSRRRALTSQQTLLQSRTTITITDEKSKHGTEVDGHKISAGSKVLQNEVHTFRLGSYEQTFR